MKNRIVLERMLSIFVIVICCCCCWQCLSSSHQELENSHKLAIEMSISGDYDGALESLREIVNQYPTAQYLNDLGVTYLRKRDFIAAQQSFQKALSVDPNYELAQINLEDIEKYLKTVEQVEKKPIERKQEHNLKCLPRLTLRRLLQERDKTTLMKFLERPFFVPAMRSSPQVKERIADRQLLFSLANLSDAYGSIVTDFYPNNMETAQVNPYLIPLHLGIQKLLSAGTTTPQYLQWNLPLSVYYQLLTRGKFVIPPALDDSHWLPLCFNETAISSFLIKTHWKMLLIGTKGAGMFNHQDTLRTGSWQIQITGRKLWHICSSTQSASLYDAGDVDTFSPDYSRFPLFRHATCFQETLSPGDMLYYPRDYWHQTKSLDTPTISFSSSVVSRENFKEVWEELKQECDGRGLIFTPSVDVCESLEKKCYDVWTQMFA